MGPKRKREDETKKKDEVEELEEAIEESLNIDEEEKSGSSEGEGEDLLENLEDDYKAIPELDKYNYEELDEEQYSEMDPEERRKIEEHLERRDKKAVKSKRIPAAILEELEENSDEEELRRKLRRNKMRFTGDIQETEEYKDTENYLNREDVKGKESEWLRQPHVIRYIQATFNKFIKNFKEDDKPVYENRIVEMCSNNKQSLEVNFTHIQHTNRHLSNWIVAYPNLVLPYLNDQAFFLTCEIFPNYSNMHNEIYVRIRDIPVLESLRDLRHHHLNTLVKVRGVVTKRTNVFPQLKKVFFYCFKCGEKKGPFFINGQEDGFNIGSCLICQSNGPFNIDVEDTVYRNYQKVTVQESPGTVPPGRVPRQKEVILTNDLVDSIRPGDEVEIVACFISRFDMTNNIKHSFPVFNTFLEANFVKRLNELEIGELTDEDKIEIRKLAKNPNISNLIFGSIAPFIYGNDFIKKALALAMFGGVSKDINNKHKIRGDINVLLLGDPGCAKSQFLKYLKKVFHRSVYTTGKGASAVGLTAGVHKDPVTREWTLEGGALVLADKGICLIDEFDKMNEQDRTSIHEAMEQQSISISKAGIVTTLQARCSVIAAANPIKGRYDNQLTFADNVDLTEPILSRFDILCVVKDEVDIKIDTALSTFVINSHIQSHPEFDRTRRETLLPDPETEKKETISQELLRKYIMYARKYVQPKLSDLNKNKVSKFYAELRKESELVGGISIAVRHLESIIRISEAHARMNLREYVLPEDIDLSIRMMLDSFLQSQKHSISKNLRKKFNFYITNQEDNHQLLMNILNRKIREQYHIMVYYNKVEIVPKEISIKIETFEKEVVRELNIHNFTDFYNSKLFKNKHRIDGKTIFANL